MLFMLWLLGLVVCLQVGMIVFLYNKLQSGEVGQLRSDLQYLNKTIDTNFKHQQNLDEMKSSRLDENLYRTNKSFSELSDKVSALGEATKNMQIIGRDIAGLHSLLSAPKIRGNLGEHLLMDILKEHFPENLIESQKRLRSGSVVDAVINIKKDLMVPIDSKFPLENYKKIMEVGNDEDTAKTHTRAFVRDVKKHITDISQKYISPDDGTMDFAIMYVPAESIYFEITKHMDAELLKYALSSKVIICSPTNLFAYMQTILMGLKGMEVETRAKEILKFVSTLHQDVKNLRSDMGTLASHISSSSKKIHSIDGSFAKIEEKVSEFVDIE
jgi:DNA recombination protein RmuC